jgi:hypothetical protein
MDYEKKYKEALELARVAAFNGHQSLMEGIFPELKESEDEKIRKGLINGFNECLKNSQYSNNAQKYWHNIKIEDIFAWLEKQDPKKHEEELEKAYKTADEVQYKRGYEDAVKDTEKRREQKLAWGEEDECYMSECIGAIATKDGWSFEEKRKTKHWLKALKDRYTWKPSDEQITVLELASKYERVFTPKQIDILIGLKEQLKKLRGE